MIVTAKQEASNKLFMWLMIAFLLSLFVLGTPYITIIVLIFGLLIFFIQFARTFQINKHVASFAILWIYVFGWGVMTGGFRLDFLTKPDFYGGEGRIIIAYLPIFFIFAAPQSMFSEVNIIRLFIVIFYLQLASLLLAFTGHMHDQFGSHHAAGYASGSMFIIFTSLYAEQKKNWQRNGIIAASLMLMLANSRTTLVGLGFAFLLFYRTRLLMPKRLIVVGAGTLVGVYLWSEISPNSFMRVSSLFESELWNTIARQFTLANSIDDPTVEKVGRIGTNWNVLTRIILWARAEWLFENSPILGVGSFRFNDPNLEMQQILPGITVGYSMNHNIGVATAHNSYLHILAEGGLVGLVIYLMPWLIILRSLKARPKNTPLQRALIKMAVIIIFFMMFGALTGHLLVSPSMTLWVLFISSVALRTTYLAQYNNETKCKANL